MPSLRTRQPSSSKRPVGGGDGQLPIGHAGVEVALRVEGREVPADDLVGGRSPSAARRRAFQVVTLPSGSSDEDRVVDDAAHEQLDVLTSPPSGPLCPPLGCLHPIQGLWVVLTQIVRPSTAQTVGRPSGVPDSAVVATERRGDRTPPGRHTLKILVAPDHRADRDLERRRRAGPEARRGQPAAAHRHERAEPQPDPGHQPARRRQLLRGRHRPAAAVGSAVLPHRLLVRRHRPHVDGAADQDLRHRCSASGSGGSSKAAYPLVFIAPNNVDLPLRRRGRA